MQISAFIAAATLGGLALHRPQRPSGRITQPLTYMPIAAVGAAWARSLGILEGA